MCRGFDQDKGRVRFRTTALVSELGWTLKHLQLRVVRAIGLPWGIWRLPAVLGCFAQRDHSGMFLPCWETNDTRHKLILY